MALVGKPPEKPDELGFSTVKVKPITEEGVKVEIVDENSTSNNIFSPLDNVGGQIVDAISVVLQHKVNQELAEHGYAHPPKPVTSAGDPDDKTGNVTKADEQSFVDKHKVPLMIGGGLVLITLIIFAVKK